MKITAKENPGMVKLAKHAFPDYKGRKFYIDYRDLIDTATDNGACGGGGTQAYYKFVRLDNGKIMNVPSIGLGGDFRKFETVIPQGAACVKHSFFCGVDCGITVFLPKSMQLS
jgi:hypothetical protein